jgi:hypothetical protein
VNSSLLVVNDETALAAMHPTFIASDRVWQRGRIQFLILRHDDIHLDDCRGISYAKRQASQPSNNRPVTQTRLPCCIVFDLGFTVK